MMETLRSLFNRPLKGEYDRLGMSDGEGEKNIWSPPRRFRRLSAKVLVLALAAILIPSLLGMAAWKSGQVAQRVTDSPPATTTDMVTADDAEADDAEADGPKKGKKKGRGRQRKLVVIVPADKGNANLCKTVMSAMALGYPAPVIINWGKDFAEDSLGQSHLGKITGVLDYLDAVVSNGTHEDDQLHSEDLVLMVDAWDLWFQLPADVLLKRYHEIIEAHDADLASQWSGDGASMPMKQTIIVSSQKRCMPPGLKCDRLPESPQRADLYGPDTDAHKGTQGVDDAHDIRPWALNSGTIMGPVGDVRRYFRRTRDRMARLGADGRKLASDQGLYAAVWIEQEQWRWFLRTLDPAQRDDRVQRVVGESFEFHVGLDYFSDLADPTAFKEVDGQILKLSNTSLIAAESRALGIAADDVRLTGVPADVAESPNPLAGLVDGAAWADMAVYADFFTGRVPVMLHHNAFMFHAKKRRETWWDQTWFFPHLRRLLEDKLRRPERAEALGRVGRTTYWASPAADSEKRLPRIFLPETRESGMEEAGWETLCRGGDDDKPWDEEVFRDGLGPL